MIVFKMLIVTSLMIAGSLLLINDQISIGQFVAAEVIIILVINSVEKLILSLETVYDTLVAVEKLGHVMDLELEHANESEKIVVSQPEGLKLAMENLIFQPRDADNPLIKDVTLTINPGEKVVVTGGSGSGKSVIMALFSGLYEEYEGKIKVNDLSLEMINLEKYRSMVGDCLESEQIFHGSISENILVGRNCDSNQLKQILDLVGLKEYVYQLPDDLDTMLQPEGKGLSKKCVQGILLARAFVGEPKAIIMENALLHIDEDTKVKVLDYLFKGDWTLLMVSKDPLICSLASKILLMDNGNLAYYGNLEGYQTFLNQKS